jgi:hypothetical protein
MIAVTVAHLSLRSAFCSKSNLNCQKLPKAKRNLSGYIQRLGDNGEIFEAEIQAIGQISKLTALTKARAIAVLVIG